MNLSLFSKKILLSVVLGLSLFLGTNTTSASSLVTYQGTLKNPTGISVPDSSYTFTFNLYTQPTGGSTLWTETQTLSTSQGNFSVLLGSVTPFPNNIFLNNPNLYLGITVNSDSEMSPRQRVGSSPYAFTADAVSLSNLKAATQTNIIDNLNLAQQWNWNTLTTEDALTISSSTQTTGSLINITSTSSSLNSTKGLLYVANTGSSTNGTIARIQANSDVNSGLTVLANGNVGVGTSSPSAKLEVSGGIKSNVLITAPLFGQYRNYIAFGDSITNGAYASTTANRYVNLIATALGLTVTNYGNSGTQAADQALYVYPVAVSGTDSQLFTYMIGTNDNWIYNTNADKQKNFTAFHQAVAAYLAIPNSNKLLGQGSGITYSGSWSNSSYWGGNIGKTTSTNGSTASFSVYGPVIYIAHTIQDTNGGTFNITVDGVSVGSYTSTGYNNSTILTNHGRSYGSALIRLGNLSYTNHDVVITVTSATDPNNKVQIDWVAGAVGNNYSTGPTVAIGGIPRQKDTNADAQISVYNNIIKKNVSLLAGDGLNIVYVDTTSYLNPITGITVDNVHPNDLGMQQLSQAFLNVINAAARSVDKQGASVASSLSSLSGVLYASGSNLGIGAGTPTHTLTLPSSSTGFVAYNTVDQATNYERIRQHWNSNVYTIASEIAGTGLHRDIRLQSNLFQFNVTQSGASITTGASSTSLGSGLTFNYTIGSSSVIQRFISVVPTISQTGTGGYRGLWLSPYEQTVGSGPRFLIDAGTNTAAGGAGTHTSKFVVDANGSTGIGTSSTTYTLNVGSASVSGIVSRFQNSTGTCDINPTTTALSCSSDENLKENILSLNETSLDKIKQLNPVTYSWKNDQEHISQTGFIAQQVRTIFPHLVTEDKDTHLLSLNYMGFIPYVIKSIQELVVKIDGFAESFVTKNLTTEKTTTQQLCVGTACVTEQQFLQMIELMSAGSVQSQTPLNNPEPTPEPLTPAPEENQLPENLSIAPEEIIEPAPVQ